MNYLYKNFKIIKYPVLILIICASVLLYWNIFDRIISFDGAMNMQVAKSLASGEGFFREYRGKYFPIEIQTNAGFIVPAAIIIKIFGISTASLQMANVAFFIGLIFAIFYLAKREYGELIGVVSALIVLLTPNLFSYAFSGYGEIPSLFYSIVGLYFLDISQKRNSKLLLFISGIFFGCAFSTKYVILLCIFAFSLSFFINKKNIKNIISLNINLIAGFFSIIILYEIYRFFTLGDISSWYSWWRLSFTSINDQATGASGGSILEIILTRFSNRAVILSGSLGLNLYSVYLLILSPAIYLILSFKNQLNGFARYSYAIALAAVLYTIWWFIIAPDPYSGVGIRRFINGVILSEISLFNLFLLFYYNKKNIFNFFVVIILALNVAIICFSSIDAIYKKRYDDAPGNNFDEVVSALKSLPSNAEIFSSGWFASPTLSIYSGRAIHDQNLIPQFIREQKTNIYIPTDIYCKNLGNNDCVAEIIGKYDSDKLIDGDNSLFRINYSKSIKNNPKNYDKKINYGWMSSDEVFFINKKNTGFYYDIYLPPGAKYLNNKFYIYASIDGIECGKITLTTGANSGYFRLNDECISLNGKELRFVANNLVNNDGWDWRELSYILNKLSW